ncbi:YdcF family protein [Rhodohalobacter barkolensis]|uniref:DUF218 domain-containing protein n=1 Tax=Rhodohalobacter barkolensis TaxID=2053187 RepID=A0A2N0VGC8_9BACT|nr:ElyC/SanA/YdcF family protein [Rhodohalobacter barkolensis]PKD43237.1 hypothetical protein CWD77_11525 [Rhodohalobacter barkolensis]
MSTEAIKFILNPFTVFWLLLVVSLVFFFLKKHKTGLRILIVSTVWFFIISTPMVPKFLLTSLEDQYDPIINEEETLNLDLEYHVVVLAAGYRRNNNRFPPNSILLDKTLIRLIEGIRLHNSLPNSKLITSGRDAFSKGISQAEISKKTAVELGVDPESIITLTETLTTYHEAQQYYEKIYAGQQVIIVTDAAHMPRAMYEFSKFVSEPLASPTNFTYRSKGISYFDFSLIPSYNNIGYLTKAIHEHAAIVRNWFRDNVFE